MYNVAVDVGGTFTDVLVFDEASGELTEGKVLSTPDDPSRGVVEGMEAVCEKGRKWICPKQNSFGGLRARRGSTRRSWPTSSNAAIG